MEKTETEKSLAQTKALLECRIQELAVCQESLAKTKVSNLILHFSKMIA